MRAGKMGFEKTYYPFFQKYCADTLGSARGRLVVNEAENKLAQMIRESDDRNNRYIKWHLTSTMLPAIAIYLTFKSFEETAGSAYDYTDALMQIARLKAKKKNEFLSRLPFAYSVFRLLCRSVIAKQYPPQGWEIQWLRYDRSEIHFNMKSCIYFETTKQYNCPEMCPLFCANDDVTFSGYAPAIVFERSGTIARGQEVCDFHFKNGKASTPSTAGADSSPRRPS
jgi:hypothetical protein